jgi:hypothetical protein
MKTVARFQLPEEAHLLRGYLEAGGVKASVLDEHVVQLFWHYSNAIGGVRVVVSDNDYERAVELFEVRREAALRDPTPESVPRVWPLVLLASLAVGAPALLFGRRTISVTAPGTGQP